MSAMSETNRPSVLDDVRAALGRQTTLSPAPLESFVEPADTIEAFELIERFIEEAIAVRTQVHRLSGRRELGEKILEICKDQSGDVAISDAELFREIDLIRELTARNLSTFVGNKTDHEKLVARLANCGVGVTGADYGIAETGTIVLNSDEVNALLVSLLPPTHIAVVSSERIIATIDDAIRRTSSERVRGTNPTRSITLITGPSRTSDVELVLSIGVHGPKELHVIIFDESDKL